MGHLRQSQRVGDRADPGRPSHRAGNSVAPVVRRRAGRRARRQPGVGGVRRPPCPTKLAARGRSTARSIDADSPARTRSIS